MFKENKLLNNMKKLLLTTAIALLTVVCALGQKFSYKEGDGYNLNYDINYIEQWRVEDIKDTTVSCIGMAKKSDAGNADLVIPETVTYDGETYSVTIISTWAFEGVTSSPMNFTGSLIIPNSVKMINEDAFSRCRGFTGDLVIPNSVTTIKTEAFYDCTGFSGNLTIGNGLKILGYNAFYNCNGFSGTLTIGSGLTSVARLPMTANGFTEFVVSPDNAHYSSKDGILYNKAQDILIDYPKGKLEPLTIPNSVTSIGEAAFNDCINLTGALTIPNSVAIIGVGAFNNCSGLTGSLTIPNSVTNIKREAFLNCSGFTGSLIISNSVTTIEARVFDNCSGLTGALTIPNSVTRIGSDAFNNCSGLTDSLTISNKVKRIESGAFSNCSGLTGSLTIPNSATSIGDGAFSNCSGFTGALTIGSSVTSIGKEAFEGCSGLTQVINYAAVPQNIDTSAFFGVGIDAITLYVPEASVEAYKAADGWKEFKNIESLEPTVLAPLKTKKKAEIDALNVYVEADYRTAEWTALVKIFTDAKAEVDALATKTEVEDYDISGLTAKANAIKTDAEKTGIKDVENTVTFVQMGNVLKFTEPTQVVIYSVSGAILHKGELVEYQFQAKGVYVVQTASGNHKIIN